jgi:hypothetical protein
VVLEVEAGAEAALGAPTRRIASCSGTTTSKDSAFRRSGRFSVITLVCGCGFSTST